ncbi:MAG: hypothetical protein K9H64_06980 [Bacteroidales bacterium]|nr:hypothetical protein [Bacteroidales bacterium]MCF8455497.1 hypothetical protein [Bacteroidales bacterium]
MRQIVSIFIALFSFLVILYFLHFEKQVQDKITIEIEIQVKDKDFIQLFYLQEGKPNFSEPNSFCQDVKGGNDFQILNFDIPLDTAITKIRIDLGENPNQQSIFIRSLTLKTELDTLIFSDSLNKVFVWNRFVSCRNDTFHTVTIARKYDPYLVSAQPLNEIITELTQGPPILKKSMAVIIALIISLSLAVFHYQLNFKATKSTLLSYGFISIFFCLLAFPTVYKYFTRYEITENTEKRKLAEKPDFVLSKYFPSKYEAYYRDHFGFRKSIIKWSSNIKIRLFHASPKPELVQFGNDNFLFLTSQYDVHKIILHNYSHSDVQSASSLIALRNKQIKRKNDLNLIGIKYIPGFWPDKHTIYPENLPTTMTIQIMGDSSLADQMVNSFKEEPILFVDVRSELLEARKHKNVYLKFDSHWNKDGAFIAYQAFFYQTYPVLNIIPYSVDDFDVTYTTERSGDLTNLIAVDSIYGYYDQVPAYTLKDKSKDYREMDVKGYPNLTHRTRNDSCNNKLKVVMFRDSYTTAIVQFFSLHFYEVVYIWSSYDENLIKELKPDIVISFRVERFLEFL